MSDEAAAVEVDNVVQMRRDFNPHHLFSKLEERLAEPGSTAMFVHDEHGDWSMVVIPPDHNPMDPGRDMLGNVVYGKTMLECAQLMWPR